MTEDGLCKHGDGKPVHGKKDECQAHYRQTMRRERGLKKPGPKPDAAKTFSRYNTVTSHHRAHDRCANGHLWVEGSYKVRSDDRKVCLVCIDENRQAGCPKGHDYAVHGYHVKGYPGIRCRECDRIKQYAYRLMSKYGLTVEQFEARLAEQDYRCGICREEFDLDAHNGVCMDHDHSCCPGEKTCGRCLRKILCDSCNKLIGNARDDIARLQAAIAYLREYQPR